VNAAPRLCIVEDDTSARESLERLFAGEGFEVLTCSRGEQALTVALSAAIDCVLTDLRMPGLSGLELIDALHAELPNLPVVLMTAHGTTDTAIEAMRRGAFEYLLKPFDVGELISVVSRAVEVGSRAREYITIDPAGDRPIHALVGQSRAMQAVYKEIGRVAAKPVTVLIMGETGTGKELVARAIWQHSLRQRKPFVAVNCAAIPPNLLESEMFGHEKGAFTGADNRRIGRFEQAHEGTLFLDEIGDLPLDTQVKLLRVLQEGVVHRVGGKEPLTVDVRIIAATHHYLPVEVAAGRFRSDLWYRLGVAMLHLPPLRERAEDIPALARYLVDRHGPVLGGTASVEPDAMQLLCSQPWPGNVRQLENTIKRALLLARGFVISPDIVARALAGDSTLLAGDRTPHESVVALCARALEQARESAGRAAAATVISAVERELLAQAKNQSNGNISQMAIWLGWSRLTVREKLRAHGLRTD
jgi:nitrogen regulation protein NR(I)